MKTLSDGETSKIVYRSFDKDGKLIGTTTSLTRAKEWRDVAYVLRQDDTQAWPDNQEPENKG